MNRYEFIDSFEVKLYFLAIFFKLEHGAFNKLVGSINRIYACSFFKQEFGQSKFGQ